MMDIEFDKSLLSVHINYNNFPAKLWCLTNDPQNNSVFWSPNGDSLIVDQQRFEDELLSPVKQNAKLFKTTNFTSFIRQLNLYGFRKVFEGSSKDKHRNLHHFHNPYFRQGRPELLVHLKRLTLSNKAKMQTGEEVTCRPSSRGYQKPQHNATDEKIGRYYPSGSVSYQLKEFERSPIPGHSWILPCSDVSSFYSNKSFPLSVIRYPYGSPLRVQSRPAAFLPQDNKYIPHPLSYPAAFYSPVVCQCCTAGFMGADRAGGDCDQTSLSYSHYAYCPNYSMSHHPDTIQTTNWPANSVSESQRADMNLDTVFQMVDELQGLPNVHMVRVGTPVKASSPSLYTLPAAFKTEPASPQTTDAEASGALRDPRLRAADGHDVEKQGDKTIQEDESSEKVVTDLKVIEENIRN